MTPPTCPGARATAPAQGVEAYLDHAADTPLRPEAYDAMAPWLAGAAGNPTGAHRSARAARRAVDEARDAVAALLGVAADEVVFTSGGTEADDLAVNGVLGAVSGVDADGPVVCCSAVEHAAVLAPVRRHGGVTLAVDRDGRVELDALAGSLGPAVRLVSVMAAGNETGVLQPLDEVRRLLDRHAPHAVLHTDAVQAAPWVRLAELAAPASLISVSAHKLGGPTGVGALGVRTGTPLVPRVLGGGQEGGRRAGSHNVAGIVGFGVAAEVLEAERVAMVRHVATLAERLKAGVTAVDGVTTTLSAAAASLPNIVHVTVEGVRGDEAVLLLDEAGVALSAGSSCASGALEPSHVLEAMGVPAELSRGALRFSLGWSSTLGDVERLLAVFGGVVEGLRTAAGADGTRR